MLVRVRPALRGSLLAVLATAVAVGDARIAMAQEDPAPPNDQSKPGASKGKETASPWGKKDEARDPTVDSSGTFSHTIPIEVPAFRAITPRLSLGYQSSGGNGRLGVGWSLDGVGRIERARAGKGAPRYDAADIYLLNGEELLPCAAGSASPSCATGGTHSARTEDYSRIAYTGAGADSRWTITARDGTRSIYAPIYLVGSGNVFRWGLSQVLDTRGNAVTYTWGSNQIGCCWEYLDSVTYNGTTIKLHYEARPDKESAAVGAGALTTVQGRLKTIDVAVSGSRVRAYQLTYAQSGATSRSLLSSVRQFGKDAALDASGTVTGGTSLPAVAIAYRAGSPSFVQGDADWAVSNSSAARYFAMDINGDGKTDMLELWPNFLALGRKTWLSTGSGFTMASSAPGGMSNSSESRFLPLDVNGDGREDLVELYGATFNWGRRTWISSGTGFSLGSQDTTAGPHSDDSRFFAMDIDGDGRSDMLELYPSWGSLRRATWISTGTGFTLTSNDTGISANSNRQFFAADVNGDGRSDLLELYPVLFGSGSRHIWLSTGTGFTSGATDTITISSSSRFLTMDVNGDGKTDMVDLNPLFGTYTRKTWLSTGYGFTLASTGTMPASTSSRHLTFDVNGDQREDIVELYPAFLVFQRRVWLSTGSGFVQGASDATMGQSTNSQIVPMDVNGDGLTEMVDLYPSGFTMRRTIWRVGGSLPDLVTSITNERGGSIAVGYTPSSAWANTNNPPVVQSATDVTIADGRGGAATTTYRYAGGLYDHAGQRFVGFRYQQETQPCLAGESSCPYTETWFRQDNGAATMPERVDERTAGGQLLRSNLHEYTTNGAALPWTALPSGRWEYSYVGTGAACPGAECKRTYQARTFNAYGEVAQLVDHGDYDVAGDEDTLTTVFVPNTTAYIVNKPADVKTFQGVGTSGALLTETLDYYDGATTWNQAPTAGLVTTTARWLSSPSSFVETHTEYDAWGNPTAQVNALGARTTTALDPTYHLFPTSVTNALGQVTTTTWDAGCGQPTGTIDRNGQPTTMTYDPLCRLSQRTEPGGRFERHTWVDLGTANQHVMTERPAADGTTSPLWDRKYFDGRGRTWRTVARGPDAATGDIHVDTAYDARGQEASRTAPYYRVAGAPQPATYATTRTYDALDRLTRVTFPDGKFEATSYGLWSMTVTDELGHARTDRMDARARRVAHDETIGGVVHTATYVHDLRGHLAQSTDPLGNVITYSTDSLGRRTSMVDPDSGAWSYEHDGAGRLTAQTDAKGQRTELTHDPLDRMIGKTSRAGTPAAVTVSWTYDQVRPGFHNIGRLTTTTDGAGTKTFDHDVAGRAVETTRIIDGASYTFRHGFDAADRALWTTYPDGDTLGTPAAPLRYDAAGRLTSIPGYVTAARYDAEGNLIRIENANGTVTTRPRDPQRGWLTGISTTSGAATIQALVYTRNDKGLITQVTSPFPNEGWTYAYDELDRLTSANSASSPANSQTLTYDAIGNITSSSRTGTYAYQSEAPHAVTTAGANTYTYDDAGLMIAGADRTLTWNGDNRLASVTRAGTTMTFTYDADGARIQQVEGNVTRRYLGDDFEVRVPGPATKYVGVAGTLVARSEGTTRTWVHTDHLGSIQAETDASGAEVHRRKYRPYGEILSTSGSLSYEPRGYTGQRHDASGLVYLHARYQDPALGRFISPDLVIDGPDTIGLNRYAYAGNDPVNHNDITGLCKGGSNKGPSVAARCKRLAAEAAKKLAAAAAVAAIMMGEGTANDTSAIGDVIDEMRKIAETTSDVMKDREDKFTIKRAPQGPSYSYPKPGPVPPELKPRALPPPKLTPLPRLPKIPLGGPTIVLQIITDSMPTQVDVDIGDGIILRHTAPPRDWGLNLPPPQQSGPASGGGGESW